MIRTITAILLLIAATASADTLFVKIVKPTAPSITVTSTNPPRITIKGVGGNLLKVTVPGPAGGKGAAGAAATIAVGTVTTGNPGDASTVTNVGTSSAAVLDFHLVPGYDGRDGAPGPAGSQIYTGVTNPPDAVVGVNGDFYVYSGDGSYYLKSAGAWVLQGSLLGPPGPPGSAANVTKTSVTTAINDSTVNNQSTWFQAGPTDSSATALLGTKDHPGNVHFMAEAGGRTHVRSTSGTDVLLVDPDNGTVTITGTLVIK